MCQAAPPELLRSVEMYPVAGAVPITPSPETVGTMQALSILSFHIYLRGCNLVLGSYVPTVSNYYMEHAGIDFLILTCILFEWPGCMQGSEFSGTMRLQSRILWNCLSFRRMTTIANHLPGIEVIQTPATVRISEIGSMLGCCV